MAVCENEKKKKKHNKTNLPLYQGICEHLLENYTDKQEKKKKVTTQDFYEMNGSPRIIEQKTAMTTYGGFVYRLCVSELRRGSIGNTMLHNWC